MLIAAVTSGCSSPKDVAYFQNGETNVIPIENIQPVRIKSNDRLSIIVKSRDPKLMQLLNLTVSTNRLGQEISHDADGISSYTVGSDGTIDFPVLGALKIEGMTRGEAAAFVKGKLTGSGLVKDPVVTVEILNATFSVMGEVNTPGRYKIDKDEMNILEAISMAGDLTIQGKRDNIRVERIEADGVHTYIVDLTDMKDLAGSPAFYLKQGDVIYVEPNDVRKRQTTVNGNNVLSWSFWVSVSSLLTSIAVLIVK